MIITLRLTTDNKNENSHKETISFESTDENMFITLGDRYISVDKNEFLKMIEIYKSE